MMQSLHSDFSLEFRLPGRAHAELEVALGLQTAIAVVDYGILEDGLGDDECVEVAPDFLQRVALDVVLLDQPLHGTLGEVEAVAEGSHTHEFIEQLQLLCLLVHHPSPRRLLLSLFALCLYFLIVGINGMEEVGVGGPSRSAKTFDVSLAGRRMRGRVGVAQIELSGAVEAATGGLIG
jgi:hypothetical protein